MKNRIRIAHVMVLILAWVSPAPADVGERDVVSLGSAVIHAERAAAIPRSFMPTVSKWEIRRAGHIEVSWA